MYSNKLVAENVQKTCCLESEQTGKQRTDLRERNTQAKGRQVNVPGDVFKIKADSVWRSVSFVETQESPCCKKNDAFSKG